jgi:hypothetical protein
VLDHLELGSAEAFYEDLVSDMRRTVVGILKVCVERTPDYELAADNALDCP